MEIVLAVCGKKVWKARFDNRQSGVPFCITKKQKSKTINTECCLYEFNHSKYKINYLFKKVFNILIVDKVSQLKMRVIKSYFKSYVLCQWLKSHNEILILSWWCPFLSLRKQEFCLHCLFQWRARRIFLNGVHKNTTGTATPSSVLERVFTIPKTLQLFLKILLFVFGERFRFRSTRLRGAEFTRRNTIFGPDRIRSAGFVSTDRKRKGGKWYVISLINERNLFRGCLDCVEFARRLIKLRRRDGDDAENWNRSNYRIIFFSLHHSAPESLSSFKVNILKHAVGLFENAFFWTCHQTFTTDEFICFTQCSLVV